MPVTGDPHSNSAHVCASAFPYRGFLSVAVNSISVIIILEVRIHIHMDATALFIVVECFASTGSHKGEASSASLHKERSSRKTGMGSRFPVVNFTLDDKLFGLPSSSKTTELLRWESELFVSPV